MSVTEPRTAPVDHGTNDRRQDDDRLRTFLAAGLDLTGPAGKEARALLMGETGHPFRGTTADWPALRTLVRTTDEFARRALSDWERARTAAVVLAAVHRLDENIGSGLGVRRDDYFTAMISCRAVADEVAEAVVIAAQHEHEELKIPYLGNLLASMAFREGIDRAQANSLVRLASGLSYRQLALLVIFSHTERLDLRTTDYNGPARVPFAAVAVLQDLFELFRMSLVFQTNGDPITIRDLTPGKMTIGGMGAMLFKLMHLNRIDPDDVEELAALLR